MQDNVVLSIGDFLGFCDLNGVEAVQGERVQELEEYISKCNEAQMNGSPIVADAIWDRLMEILRQVNPESELCKYSWEDSVEEYSDIDNVIKKNPMYSIQTVKSFDCDEIKAFVDRLPDDLVFNAHISVKLNGHGIRLVYVNGEFVQARSRARSSAGRDITRQLQTVLYSNGLTSIDTLIDCDLCEIRGEWVLPFANVGIARQYNPDIKSAFSGVASMGRDSGTADEWGLLKFVAYEFVMDGVSFSSKSEEYDYLRELGFETPMEWLIEDLSKDTLIEDLKGIVSDCEDNISDYEYYTDGLVFAIDDNAIFKSLGDDGSHYKFGNMALKVGYWKQDVYDGYVQCIMWTRGKTKLSPVVIVGSDPDIIRYRDAESKPYVYSKNEIDNWDELGVVTASGNRVRRIPLYEPNNMLILSAYPGGVIHFHYGGEAGVVPCFEDGTPLLDGRVKQIASGEYDEDDIYY